MDFLQMKAVLKKNGYKNTTQRDDMFRALEKHAGEHLSPEQLHAVLTEEGNHVGIATIYRTLQIFESLGIVHKLDLDNRGYRYEIVQDGANHMHHHLICERCEAVTEIHVDLLDKLEEIVETDYRFTITDHAVKLFGICAACQQHQEETFE